MNFRIAESFVDSMRKLKGDEGKAAKTAAFDLQMNPAHPGLKFHRVERARDPNFWTVRVNRDLRLVVHKRGADVLLAYVDHHDAAYAWAERRRMEAHPVDGAVQFVEVREAVEEIVAPRPISNKMSAEPLFTGYDDATLMAEGVPPEWLDDIRTADEDRFLAICDQLPKEAAEALFRLAAGEPVQAATPERAVVAPADPFGHPDAQRRFPKIADSAELERSLEHPWDLMVRAREADDKSNRNLDFDLTQFKDDYRRLVSSRFPELRATRQTGRDREYYIGASSLPGGIRFKHSFFRGEISLILEKKWADIDDQWLLAGAPENARIIRHGSELHLRLPTEVMDPALKVTDQIETASKALSAISRLTALAEAIAQLQDAGNARTRPVSLENRSRLN